MRKVSIFAIIFGLVLICAAVLHLDDVVTVAQVDFLARSTVCGIFCVGFGVLFLIQNLILNIARSDRGTEK